MSTFPIFQIDAFTAEPFRGNPAAVVILPAPQSEAWMQAVAGEMNLSETAFVAPHEDPFARRYRLRWFTPQTEVELCGHATLATAHALWSEGYLRPTEAARFLTLSGLLTCTYDPSGWITMDFPATPAEPAAAPPGLLEALGAPARFVGRSPFDYLVELETAEHVRALRPDLARLAAVPARGVMATAPADQPGYDFVSRFFGPAVGVPEDPVTGSAHCCLGPFWGARLGKSALVGYQASARGGVVRVALEGERVRLSGQAVTVLRGELGVRKRHPAPAARPTSARWEDEE